MEGLFKAMDIDDEETQEQAFSALAEVPRVAQDSIDVYISTIGGKTMDLMARGNPKSIKQGFEFWISLCSN